MALIAHLQRLRGDGLEVDAAQRAGDDRERRAQHVAHPRQTAQHVLAVRAKAQRLAQTLVEIAEGAIAAVGILNDQHRHRCRDHPGHGAHCVEVMARRELDGSLLAHLACGGIVWGKPLKEHGADDGSLHRSRHVLPCQRRAGVKNGALGHAREGLLGGEAIQPHGLRSEHPLKCDLVGRIDGIADVVAGHQGGQRPSGLSVASQRWRPVDR